MDEPFEGLAPEGQEKNRQRERTVSSSVALTSPPSIVIATGLQDLLARRVRASIISGMSATPADRAVMSTGVRRSRLGRVCQPAGPNGSPSLQQAPIDVVADLQDAVEASRCRSA